MSNLRMEKFIREILGCLEKKHHLRFDADTALRELRYYGFLDAKQEELDKISESLRTLAQQLDSFDR